MNPSNKCVILGALCIETGRYILPSEATKGDQYTCIGCNDKVFVRKGPRNKPHFCHYRNSECKYYEHASESEIHKNAKLRIKSLLEQKCEVSFIRNCKLKSLPFGSFGRCERNPDIYSILVVTKTSKIVLEYPFKMGYSGVTYFADVAYIDEYEPLCMIEVCHTHATSKERRVDPWFEVSAKNVLEAEVQDNTIQFTCIRQEVCDECLAEGYEQRYKNLSSQTSRLMKDDDLEFFVRYQLGQRDFKNNYRYRAEGDHEWYEICRPDHKRIHFDEGDKNNNEIITLFHRHLNNIQVIIQTRKGSCDVDITADITKCSPDYIKCNPPQTKNYNGWGTVSIIKDILKLVHKSVPFVSTLSKSMFQNTPIVIKKNPVIENKKTTPKNYHMAMSSFLSDSIMMDSVRNKKKSIKELQTKK